MFIWKNLSLSSITSSDLGNLNSIVRRFAEDLAIIEDYFTFKFIISHLPTCSPDIFGDFELITYIDSYKFGVRCLVCLDTETMKVLETFE